VIVNRRAGEALGLDLLNKSIVAADPELRQRLQYGFGRIKQKILQILQIQKL
jgi:hypothetical protein